MNNIFKAGDFTSGKMSEIFKQCYLKDIAIIDHKQFGRAYMVPDVFFRALATGELLERKDFCDFVDLNFGSTQEFMRADDEQCFEEIEEYFGGEFEFFNWFDVLNHVLMVSREK